MRPTAPAFAPAPAFALAAALALAAPAGAAIGVVSAFPPEWEMLKAALEAPQSERINGTEFVTGTLEGKEVVLFLSGVSMVNAAMTTQLALERFGIDGLVFSGIAGGVDPALAIGDVVIAGEWAQYLESVFAREAGEGWAVPPFLAPVGPNYGMIHPMPVGVASDAAEAPEETFWFPVDAGWLEVARRVAASVTLEACSAADACLSDPPEIVVGGRGVSGPAFVDNAAFREWVAESFAASVLDMESAAVAHVAKANGVPFIAVRSLSDLAGGGGAANEMPVFLGLAAGNSAAVVRAFLAALP